MGRSVSFANDSVQVDYASFHQDAWYCSQCGDTFDEFKTATLDDGAEAKVCPHCGTNHEDCHRNDCGDGFQDCIDCLQEVATKRYPSLSKCDDWIGREDYVILENAHAYIGVSEYCGLVSVWVTPKADRYTDAVSGLALHWCEQISLEPLAECFGDRLISCGRFSNGEQFFSPANGEQKGALGLGFTSHEGWL